MRKIHYINCWDNMVMVDSYWEDAPNPKFVQRRLIWECPTCGHTKRVVADMPGKRLKRNKLSPSDRVVR